MSKEIDYDKPLSKEDEKYLRDRGHPADLQRAGLQPVPDFDLSMVPGAIQEHELKGEGEPVFDKDSKIARESEGSEPDSEHDRVVKSIPGPIAPDPVAVKQNEQKPPAKTSGKTS
jgi:hypothetical protein